MKKEDLIKLGLDEETATKVAEASSQELQGFIPKHRFDEVNNLKNEYQIKVEELSKSTANADEFKNQVEKLQTEMATKETEFQTKLKEINENNALRLKLNDKVHDIDYAISKFDRSKLEFDDKGNIVKGFDEQEAALKESAAFLFKQAEQSQQQFPFQIPKIGASNGQKQTPKEAGSLNEAVSEALFGNAQN